MTRRVLLAILPVMLACGASARLVEPERHPAPYCFALLTTFDGGTYALACAQSVGLCEHARDLAVSWSGPAGFSQVGPCGLRGVR